MRIFFTVIARFIATIFAALFVVSTILALTLTSMNQQLFNASIYKNALVEQDFYDHLQRSLGEMLTTSLTYNPCLRNPLTCEEISPELKNCYQQALGVERYIALTGGIESPSESEQTQIQACLDQLAALAGDSKSLTTGGAGGGMPLFMKNLKAADWQVIFSIILPREELQAMIESTLDQFFGYLDGTTNTVSISLDKLKERLTGPTGAKLILQLINAQPACTDEDLIQIATGESKIGTIICKPPEFVLGPVVSLLQEQLEAVAIKIPDEAPILKPPSSGAPSAANGPSGTDPVSNLRTIRLIMRLSPIAPLVFLLMITLFAVRSLKSWMRWWGIPIFISGILGLVLGLSTQPIVDLAWTKFLLPRIPAYIPVDITAISQELVGSIVHSLSEKIILQAVILGVIGLAGWVVSCLIKKHIEPEAPVNERSPAA
jgi:hypothetical protein